MLSFVSPGVLGEYAKSLFASLHIFLPRILRICFNNFCVFKDDFVYRNYKTLLAEFMETTHNGEVQRKTEHISVNNGPT